MAIIKENKVGGEELLRSPYLTLNSWTIPPKKREGWGQIQIRVYVVDPSIVDGGTEWRRDAPMRTPEMIAWQRK